MTKIIHRNQSSKSAALGLLRAGFRPHLAQTQRRYKAEYRRILGGGQPPGGLTRDHALAWLGALIGGYRDTLQRIALVASRADSPVMPGVPRIKRHEAESVRQTGPPPPKTQRRPVEGNNGALRAVKTADVFAKTSPPYHRNIRRGNKKVSRGAWLDRFADSWLEASRWAFAHDVDVARAFWTDSVFPTPATSNPGGRPGASSIEGGHDE